MTDTDPVFPMAGYVVLRVTAGTRYKGIDRSPFEPEVLEDEIASNPGPSGQIYTLYPPGWRRDALHVFEDGLVTGTGVGVYLVRTIETATTICELVSRHLAPHDVLACTIWR